MFVSLFITVESGNRKMLDTLLEYGADPNNRNGKGETALFLACALQKTEFVEALIKAGTNPHLFNDEKKKVSNAVSVLCVCRDICRLHKLYLMP